MTKRLLWIALAAGLAFGCAQFKLLQPGVGGEDPVVLMTGYFGGKGNLSVTSKDGTTVKITQDGASEGLVSMFTGLRLKGHGATERQGHLAGHRVLVGDAADAIGAKELTGLVEG